MTESGLEAAESMRISEEMVRNTTLRLAQGIRWSDLLVCATESV